MSTTEISRLIKQAEVRGAAVSTQFDHTAITDGLEIIESVHVVGLEGMPARWMSTEYAIIKLREVLGQPTQHVQECQRIAADFHDRPQVEAVAELKRAGIPYKTFSDVVMEMAAMRPMAKIYTFPTVMQ